MSELQRIAEILWQHRWYANRDKPPFGRCACDWPPAEARLEINAREHPAHVAEVLITELGRADLITERAEAIAAAKAAFAALPENRRRELEARFDLAALEARQHASYVRP